MSWQEVISNEVLDIRDGTHDSPKYIKTGYPLITSKNLKQGIIDFSDVNLISEEDYIEINKRSRVNKGDILYSMIGSIGNYALVNEEPDYAIKNVALFKFIDHRLYNKYFLHLINSFVIERQIQKAIKGGTQKFVSLKILRNLKIPLPPLDQQKKIADILDAADAYRQKTKALIEKYDELTQSLFLDMFGDPVSNPKKLPVKSLGELCEFYSGRAWKKAELGSHGYKLVRISNLHKQSFPYWLYEGEMIEKHKVEDGDLLFSWAGVQASIDAYIYKGETAMINQHIYNIKPRNEMSKLFLYNLLQLHLDNLRGSLGGGVGQFHLKKTDVTGIKVILPNEVTMNKYLSSLASLNKQKAQAQASLAQAEDLFNSLLQRAFKGELTA